MKNSSLARMQNIGSWIWQNDEFDPASAPALLVDIDGVISDASHRQSHLRSEPKDWKGFFFACADDPPIQEMFDFLSWSDDDLKVVLLTARPSWVDEITLDWLKKFQPRWDLLVIRSPEVDHLSALEFKREAYQKLVQAGFNFQIGFDDDPKNVEMFASEGLNCVYVHSGYYQDKTPTEGT